MTGMLILRVTRKALNQKLNQIHFMNFLPKIQNIICDDCDEIFLLSSNKNYRCYNEHYNWATQVETEVEKLMSPSICERRPLTIS